MDKALRLASIILLMLFALPVSATTRYVSQSGGVFSGGVACNGHLTISASTYSSVPNSPDDFIYLCGTITSGFTVDGGGTSGHVVTIKWDAGARVSVAKGQIINLHSTDSFVLFDGGFACGPGTTCDAIENSNMTGYAAGQTGIIEATANGSALANQNTSTQAFYACDGCHDIEIRNFIIRNLYQHTLAADTTANADSGNFVFQCASGSASGCVSGTISIHDSFIHDTGNAISIQKNSSNTVQLYNVDFARNNWALEMSGNGTRSMFFHNSTCRDAANWDTGVSDTFHHNCIHNYMNTSSDSVAYLVYDILATGDWGTCCATSNFLFTETAPPANMTVFNNVVIQNCAGANTEPGVSMRTVNAGAGPAFYNNTFLGCAATGSNVEAVDYWGTGLVIENNAIEGYGQFVVTGAFGSVTTFTTLDYNTYGAIGMSGNAPWQLGATAITTFAAWKSDTSGDTNGQKVASIGVNSTTGVPNAGSALLTAGANLTSTCSGNLVPLCTDFAGEARPNSAWSVGAFQNSSAAPAATKGIMGLVF